jgi:Polysaccharide lyase
MARTKSLWSSEVCTTIRLDLKAPSSAGDPWPNRLFLQTSDKGQITGDDQIWLYDSSNPAISPTRVQIYVDTWYTYVLGVKPGYDGTGHLYLWINGVRVVNYTGAVGYKPEVDGDLPGTLASLMVKSGIYRNSGNPNVTFAFDNIKYGNTYSEVNP